MIYIPDDSIVDSSKFIGRADDIGPEPDFERMQCSVNFLVEENGGMDDYDDVWLQAKKRDPSLFASTKNETCKDDDDDDTSSPFLPCCLAPLLAMIIFIFGLAWS